jgi:coproporphyrinogen III oxidase
MTTSSLRSNMLNHVTSLQQRIITALEAFEPEARFAQTPWTKPAESLLQGHGIMALLEGGAVFEKFGVNISHVHGTFPQHFTKEIPGAEASNGQFWACGLSLVGHPRNPHVPAVHANIRRLETSFGWFGGGMDLTPALPYAEDTAHFHATCATACAILGPTAHGHYQQWCKDYFFLPHRNEERGIGGIFFDNLNDNTPTHGSNGTPEAHLAFTQAVGEAFLTAYPPLVAKRHVTLSTEAERATQLRKRGRYAEFNLLYDRGTRFGLQTGGNPEAILMSLPPLAAW